MNIDLIREKIAEKLNDSFDFWSYCLTNTTPGNYGSNEWGINATMENIYVDIPNRKFTFKDVEFNFDVRLNSSGEDGFDENFFFLVDGEGKFNFPESGKIILKELKLITPIDLFPED